MATQLQSFWLDQNAPGDPSIYDFQFVWTSVRLGPNSWSPKQLFYSFRANPSPGADLTQDGVNGFSAGTDVESQETGNPPPVALSLTSSGNTTSQLFIVPGNVAPIAIDAAGKPDIWSYFSNAQGPYKYLGNWWLIANMTGNLTEIPPRAPVRMGVYKSTNFSPTTGVGTWTRMDQAHEPTNVMIFNGNFDGSEGKFRFFVTPTPGSVYALQEFDTSTGLWGAAHDSISISVSVSDIDAMVYSTSAGITTIFYTHAPAPRKLAYFNGSAWTIDVSALTSNTPPGSGICNQALLDPNGTTIHVFYQSSGDGVYQQVTGNGTGLGPQIVMPNGQFAAEPGKATIFTDPADGIQKICLPVDWNVRHDADISPACFIGFPLSNPANLANQPETISTYVGDKATCTYTVLLLSTSQTLQLIKQVTGGGPHVPTDWTLSANGPTPISGAGGVGPASVGTGTYALSEALGPTWASLTQTWASDSNQWNGGYTAGNWVCTGGGSMPDGQTVIIPAGANIVCTITNTFIPPAPPPQPGNPCSGTVANPATDTQFELRRVYASMKPAPRVPVRGGTG